MDLITTELKLNYLNRRSVELAQLQALAISQSVELYKVAEKIGHQIRGNAQTFELAQLANPAVELQNAALEKSKDKILAAVLKLTEKVNQALTALS